MSVPALRFKEFSDDWKKRKLEEITKEKISYGIVQAGPHIEGGVPYIKSSNVGGIINLVQLQRTSSDIHFKYRRSAVHPNDIVFSLRGNIGEVSIVPSEIHEANLTQGTARVSVDDLNNNKFVFFQMQTRTFLDSVNERSKGSTFQEISLGDLRLVGIMLSSIAEQTKIANFLTAVDEKISLITQKHDLLTQYKKGVMQQVFSQKLRFKDDDGKDFPKWEIKCIGDIFEERSERDFADAELLSVTMHDGIRKRTDIDAKNNSSTDKSNYKKVLSGDVVYNSMRMWQGASGVSDFDGIVSPAYTVLKSNINHNSLYFAYLFKTKEMIQTFQRSSQGLTSDTWNLKYPELSKIAINTPKIKEQTKVANFLTAIDDKITITQAQLDAVKQYKQGLLQQMFV